MHNLKQYTTNTRMLLNISVTPDVKLTKNKLSGQNVTPPIQLFRIPGQFLTAVKRVEKQFSKAGGFHCFVFLNRPNLEP